MSDFLNADWNAFLEVGLAGSLSKAATRLRVRQPGLTRRLQRLESSIGIQLFERTNRGVRLTQTGQSLFTSLLAQREQLLNVVSSQIRSAEEIHGPIRLGCHRSVATLFLPSWISTLLANHPQLQPEFHFADSHEVLRLIQQGKLDFGIIVEPQASPDLVVRKIFTETVGTFELPRATRSKISLLIYNPEMVLLPRLRALMRKNRVLAVADYEVAAAMASQIRGSVALLPASVAHRWKLIEHEPILKARIYLVYRNSMRGTRLATIAFETLTKIK